MGTYDILASGRIYIKIFKLIVHGISMWPSIEITTARKISCNWILREPLSEHSDPPTVALRELLIACDIPEEEKIFCFI
jgi:hypothetical protein